ncbi:alpha/beta fold hydrolase [Kribbella sp. NPDC048915]|uniref:alpha/beta fold hydrolase n=1 Tax=Kribbella sp. NPDC048915 TaxID=3155148 RepID=UPI0033DAC5AF
MRDLYHGDQMMKFVRAGFAVVAPDYAGLGTDGRHELGNKVAGSNDVLHAISAARTAVPHLSRRWVLWGHSQGGGIGLAVGEVQRTDPAPGYLGAVITAPAANLPAIAERVATTPGFGGFVPLLIAGAQHGDPKVDPAKLLAAEAFAVGKCLGLTKTGCLGVVTAAYAHLSGEQLVSPAYWVDPRFAKFLENNTVGRRPIGGPVLLLQGTSDAVIPRGETDDIARRLCAVGTRLDYRVYPGLDHDTTQWSTGIDDGAMPDILKWVTDRFAGKPARTTC